MKTKMNIMKTRFQEKADTPGALQLYFYDDIAPDDWDWWTGEKIPSETSAETVREKLAEYPNATTIEIHINSMGGSVLEGYGIYAQLRNHTAKKVVYIDGFACSVASIIALAGDEVYMNRNAMMCIHNVMDGCWGNAADHRKCADDLDKIMEGNRAVYMSAANETLTEERLIEMLNAETWLTAAECKEIGWCTEILEEDGDLSGLSQHVDQRTGMLAAQLNHMKMLKELIKQQETPAVEPDPSTEPGQEPPQEPPQDPEPKQGNTTHRMLAALFR